MRLHRNLCFTVIDSLSMVFNDGEYAGKVVEKALKRDARWGARDRKFVAETIYDVVRWKRLYNEIAGTKDHYTRDNIWKLFAVGRFLKGLNYQNGNILKELLQEESKGNLTNAKMYVLLESLSLIGWMKLVLRN